MYISGFRGGCLAFKNKRMDQKQMKHINVITLSKCNVILLIQSLTSLRQGSFGSLTAIFRERAPFVCCVVKPVSLLLNCVSAFSKKSKSRITL